MASLILHNVPQHLLDALERRAQLKHKSLEDEALDVLSDSLGAELGFAAALSQFLATPFEHEEPYVDPFEGIRDPSPGREVDLWED